MASSSAERISLSVSPAEKPASRSFHASSAVASTITAAGEMVWPWPQSTPARQVTSMAAEVVSSAPCPARSVCTLSSTASTPTSARHSSATGMPSRPPSAPSMQMKPKVRSPASLPRRSRSSPISRPSARLSASRTRISR